MTGKTDLLDEVRRTLEPSGLIPRGGFHPEPEDGVPGRAGTLVLVGNAGPAMWEAFRKSSPKGSDPLDGWTRRVLEDAARRLGARALLPSDGPPYLPFQRWALAADAVHPSPIGMLIHPDFGLWHAYRGALAFADRRPLPQRDRRPRPCDDCRDRPCLTACPVGALGEGVYDVGACVAHIVRPEGEDCLDEGCRARRACPVGRDTVYAHAQARFHMSAFIRAQHRPGSGAPRRGE